MTGQAGADQPQADSYLGIYEKGVIRLSAPVSWPDGTVVTVQLPEPQPQSADKPFGKVIIAGFGLAGRWVADIFERHGIEYVIIETNKETVETQHKLGRRVIEGNVSEEETLRQAGIEDASILALTVPDDAAVLEATRLARRMKPGIYIVARTSYSSSGLRATQLGADEVIKAEQAVARQFYEMMLRKVGMNTGDADAEK
ncbi:MAG TPA: NAD(P)-binding protein [Phycisphaerae bacterium]|nr:NAD(P)-binding protein [Phycisphaerae bacterium]